MSINNTNTPMDVDNQRSESDFGNDNDITYTSNCNQNIAHAVDTSFATFSPQLSDIRPHPNRNDQEERNTRQRIDEPVDDDFVFKALNPEHNIPFRYSNISIEELMTDSPRQKRTVLYLQLLRIVSGSSDGGNRGQSSFTYYNKSKKDKSTNSSYSRMFLFREINSPYGQVVYMIEGRSLNERLWIRNPQFRDNGTISIGTCIALLCPAPIQNQLGNEIPILECCTSGIVLSTPNRFLPIKIDDALPQHVTRSFVINNAKLECLSTNIEVTKCSGLFCDRQRVLEILRSNKGCGCYSMQTRLSNLSISHSLIVKKNNVKIFAVDEFSSLRFSKLYLSSLFSPTSRINLFEQIRIHDQIEDSIDDVITEINGNEGFTIIGWYKRGDINDQNNNENTDNRVEAGEIGFHIVSISPTNKNIPLDNLKFDVGSLNII